MITTRPHSETIIARIRRDREFARLFYAGAVEMLLEGDAAGALSRLRDLVNAQITFKELSRQTGLGEKSLHRMLNRNGNPTARNLGAIVRSIAEDLHIKPRVEVAANISSTNGGSVFIFRERGSVFFARFDVWPAVRQKMCPDPRFPFDHWNANCPF